MQAQELSAWPIDVPKAGTFRQKATPRAPICFAFREIALSFPVAAVHFSFSIVVHRISVPHSHHFFFFFGEGKRKRESVCVHLLAGVQKLGLHTEKMFYQ